MKDNDMNLKGRVVKYTDPIQRFERYGEVVRTCRVKLDTRKITATGKIVKRPTIEGLVVRDRIIVCMEPLKTVAGKERRIPMSNILAVHYYGRDVPIREWMDEHEQA